MNFTWLVATAAAVALQLSAVPVRAQRGGGGGGGGTAYSPLRDVPILKYNSEANLDGSYHYNYETGNGIRAQEDGYLKNRGSTLEAQVMQGSYSYTGPDGVLYSVTYVADERGFRAEGAHLPTPPPLPPAIRNSLLYNAANAQPARYKK